MSQSSRKATIRAYSPGDEHGIVRLFEEIFCREMTLEEWRWKYKGLGNQKVYSYVVVNENNEIVGHYGAIPLRMTYHGKNITGLVTCDAMIQPKYRGMWTLRKLHNTFVDSQVQNGIFMFYGFPNEKNLLLPAEKMGLYERVETVLDASKDVTFHDSIERFLYKLEPLNFHDRRIDRLWSSVKEHFPLSIIRDGFYFQWRYEQHHLFTYEIWSLKRRASKNLVGLVVLKKDDIEKLLLMDLVFHPRTFRPLLKKVENLAFKLGKKKLNLWLPQRMHPELRKLGFAFVPSGAILPRSTHPATIKKEEMQSYFYYTCGDTDFL
ncbi:MAG: GNAT family N-acetyltransferase [Nitrospirota bacterium]